MRINLAFIIALTSFVGCANPQQTPSSPKRKRVFRVKAKKSSPAPMSTASIGMTMPRPKINHRSQQARTWRRMIRHKSVELVPGKSVVAFRGLIQAPEDAIVLLDKGTDIFSLVYLDHGKQAQIQFQVLIEETGQILVSPKTLLIEGNDMSDCLINLQVSQGIFLPPESKRTLIFLVTPVRTTSVLHLGMLPLKMSARVGQLVVKPKLEPRYRDY